MAIVTMRRMSAALPLKNRRKALRALSRLGCVEITELPGSRFLAQTPDVTPRSESTNADRHRAALKRAKDILKQYVPEAKKAFGPKPVLTEDALFDEKTMDKALEAAANINRLSNAMEELKGQKSEAQAKIQFLTPWLSFDVPVEQTGTATVDLWKGTLPQGSDLDAMKTHGEEQVGPCVIQEISQDRDLIYLLVLAHQSKSADLMMYLRQQGFAKEDFTGQSGLVKNLIAQLESKIREYDEEFRKIESQLVAIGNIHPLLEQGYDAYAQEETRDRLLSSLGYTKKTVILEGWTPARDEERVSAVLEQCSAAYEFCDPDEEDFPPTVLDSGLLAQPLNAITEMYGMPKYGSVVDPNIAMLPFYVVFFGAIMADMAYGLLIFFGCLLGLKLLKPQKGTNMYNMLRLFTYCGLSTIVFGALTGSFLGDLFFVVTELFTGTGVALPPLWFSPMDDPMTMLIFCMVLGVIQILFGLGASGLRMIKQGKAFDAFCDIGSWYLIFIGGGVGAVGFTWGFWILGAGLAVLFITGGRHKKGLGKVFGGVGKLYDIVGFMSDVLSYSRIMALSLSGAVVASVFNKMGAMGGNGIFGILLLVFACVIGHVFNLAISVLGAYVHTSRLQYIEYFGRFYEEGGRTMKPLKNQTKYVQIKD